MPKNERIIEKYIGVNELTKIPMWDRIHDFKNLKIEDRIRIFEDRLSKEDNNPIIDGYIQKLPKVDSEMDITEIEVETVNNRNARLEKEKLSVMKKGISQ